MSWMTEYSWDGQILHKTKSELKPKLEQKFVLQNKLQQQQNQFF